jgi:cytochrome c-type biogenesis protein CcmE
MKKTEIVLIVLVAVIIGVIMSLTFNASTYITFADSEKQMGKEFTVIGSLTFFAADSLNNERKIYYHDSKPQDFERSEKITMTGFATDSGFVARTILMKCPSKYNEQQYINQDTLTSLTY